MVVRSACPWPLHLPAPPPPSAPPNSLSLSEEPISDLGEGSALLKGAVRHELEAPWRAARGGV